MKIRTLIAIVLLGLAGCSDAFDPKGVFDKRVVVYSVLSTTADTLFVRIHTTYDPPGYDPMSVTTEPAFAGATASLNDGRSLRALRDTLLPRPDAARYGATMKAFYVTPFKPRRGAEYSVQVDVPGYPQAIGATIVPDTSNFFLTNASLLGLGSSTSQALGVILSAPPTVRGYLVQLFVDYTVSTDGSKHRTEIASRVVSAPGGTVRVYPQIAPTSRYAGRDFDPVTYFEYSIEAWKSSISSIYGQYGHDNVFFSKATVYLYLIDHHLYNYSSLVNGFRDEVTVRTDQPDYSNVVGGAGVVGSYTLDSLWFSIPAKAQ